MVLTSMDGFLLLIDLGVGDGVFFMFVFVQFKNIFL